MPVSETPTTREPFDLARIWLESALLALIGSAYFADYSLAAMWAWLGAVLWMCLNIGALALMIRAWVRSASQGGPDWGRGAGPALAVFVILPGLLIGLLSWAQSRHVTLAVAAGITLPLVVVVFRAVSLLLTRRKPANPKAS